MRIRTDVIVRACWCKEQKGSELAICVQQISGCDDALQGGNLCHDRFAPHNGKRGFDYQATT
jgi:hypothetical protein